MPRINFEKVHIRDGLVHMTGNLQSKSKLKRITCQSTNESQFQFDYNPESRLHRYRATMAIVNQYDGEVVDGATNFQKREIPVSDQSRPTDKSKAHVEAVYRNTHRQVDQEVSQEVYQDATEAAYRERNHEVDRIVTE